jgi:hypothetical protein
MDTNKGRTADARRFTQIDELQEENCLVQPRSGEIFIVRQLPDEALGVWFEEKPSAEGA